MANIRINSLPAEASPSTSDVVPIDGATTRKTTIVNLVNAARPFASQSEAEAGTATTVAMNPLTTAQAIAAQGGTAFATAAQGLLADSAVQPAALNAVKVPAGGTTGQVLGKVSGTDNDVAWQNAGAGDLLAANNLSDLDDSDASLSNLGGGASGIPIFKAANTAALSTALAGAVNDATLASPSILHNRVYGHIDITDYGAIGDGVTDNAVPWSDAINAAIAQKKVVEIPAGDFYLSAGKTITSAPNGFGIVGTSKMRSRLFTDQNTSLVYFDAVTSSFNWLEFRNFRAAYTGTAGARTAANAAIRYGQSSPNAATGINRMTHDDLFIEGFYHGIRYGQVGQSTWSGTSQIERYYVPVISNCHILTCGLTGVVPVVGIKADRGPGAHGLIIGNIIESTTSAIAMGSGSTLAGCGDQIIVGNHLLGIDAGCIAVDIYGPSDYASGGYNQNFTITGNQFDGLMATTVRMRNMQNFRITPNNSTAAAGIDVTSNCSDYIVEDRNTVTMQDLSVDDLSVRSTNGARFSAPLALRRTVNNDRIVVSGGNTGTDGAQISAYGGAHATLANYAIVDADTVIARNKVGTTSAVLQPTVANIPGAYASTSASAANLLVESDGRLRRSTSALKYKNVLSAIPAAMVEKVLGISGFVYSAKDDPDGRHFIGMAADHFHDAGLAEFVTYGPDGEVEGLQYERLAPILIQEIRNLRQRVDAIEVTGPENTALAMLRTGCSFAEASESTNVSVERLMAMWKDRSS